MQELQKLDYDVDVKKRDIAISVEVADVILMLCDKEWEMYVQVVTASGAIKLCN